MWSPWLDSPLVREAPKRLRVCAPARSPPRRARLSPVLQSVAGKARGPARRAARGARRAARGKDRVNARPEPMLCYRRGARPRKVRRALPQGLELILHVLPPHGEDTILTRSHLSVALIAVHLNGFADAWYDSCCDIDSS